MVKKLNWFFLVLTVIICTRHLIGTGYFIRRSVSYRFKAARREEDIDHKQGALKLVIEAINGHEARIQQLSTLYTNPRNDGLEALRNDITWWLDQQRINSDTNGLPGQNQQSIAEYFDAWTFNYQIPSLSVLTEEQAKYSAYTCYGFLIISGLLMLLVFMSPRIE